MHSRLWSNRLWVLSGALGASTLGATAAIIHDTARQSAAAGLVARSTAEQVGAAAAGRLEILALQTFAPAAPWEVKSVGSPQAELDALVRSQANAIRCQCRDTLPAETFFRFDVASGRLETKSAEGAPAAPLRSAVLEAVARREAERAPGARRPTTHFAAPPSLDGRGTVTIVQSSERGAPLAVYGLVAPATAIARSVFSTSTRSTVFGSNARAIQLDSLSLAIHSAGTQAPIFGAVSEARPFHSTVFPTGSLEGLGITTALTREQAVRSLVVSRQELWHLGVLTLATIFAIVFAVGSSRREVLLARARSDFIAGVSHDLRMPLAQILIAGETLTLRRERDETERMKLSSSIVREARRLMSIVDNVLLFSRSGAVALRPMVQPLAVSALFEDVVDAVRLACDDAGQTIEIDDPSALVILGDRELLRQALVNLVDNALKYGAPGQRILLGARRESAKAQLFVEDEGPGVPPAERARIFEPYERLSRDQTSERTGTGLGLAVVRHIAQVCGGRVWIEESTAGGTRAVIELPASEATEPAVPERELV